MIYILNDKCERIYAHCTGMITINEAAGSCVRIKFACNIVARRRRRRFGRRLSNNKRKI